jgi:hypothetical protein
MEEKIKCQDKKRGGDPGFKGTLVFAKTVR